MELRLYQQSAQRALVLHTSRVLRVRPASADQLKRRFALLAPYRSCWMLHSLREGNAVLHNGVGVRQGQGVVLQAEDGFAVNGTKYRVEAVTVDVPTHQAPLGTTPPRCLLTLGSDREFFREEADCDLIIGRTSRCGQQLSPGYGLETEHALLAFVEGSWHLHDLTGKGMARAGEQTACRIRLRDGDRIHLGDVKLCYRLANAAQSARAVAAGPLPDARTPACELACCPALGSAETASGISARTVEQAHLDRDIYDKGKALCGWLRGALDGEMIPSSTLLSLKFAVGFWTRRPDGLSPLEVLDRFKENLAQAPRNRDLLLALARFFEEHRHFDLCLFVLKRLHRLIPHDVELMRAVAEVCLIQAREPAATIVAALDANDTARHYVERAQRQAPGEDRTLGDLQNKVRAERTRILGELRIARFSERQKRTSPFSRDAKRSAVTSHSAWRCAQGVAR